MKKLFLTFFLCLFLAANLTANARAAEDTMLRVGLKYGSSALFSANLENAEGGGWGYRFGWFDENDQFHQVGYTGENTISMTAGSSFSVGGDGTYSPAEGGSAAVGPWSLELNHSFADFDSAAYAAAQFQEAFPAYVGGTYRVRIGCWSSQAEAEAKAALYLGTTWKDASNTVYDFSAGVVTASSTLVTVTVTRTSQVLFQFDGQGSRHLGVMPDPAGAAQAITWFKGYRYYGSFEYRRSGSSLTVINVVDLEDYVKGVVPYEMSSSWPLEALKAQAVCARTFALRTTKHASLSFDVCAGTDCQVYYGVGSATALTDRAVEETAGICVWYKGELAETVYCSSNGGASESAENVWGGSVGYLIGKTDPYEAMTSIPSYQYSVTYTPAEVASLLRDRGYSIGTVTDLYVSRYSPTGNAAEVTVTDTSGQRITITGDTCRIFFSSSAMGKSVRSLRFTITGGSGGTGIPVNPGGGTLGTLNGAYVISGSGTVSPYSGGTGETYVITGGGTRLLESGAGSSASSGVFTLTGTGYGHNVGMSQYGAKAMAEQGLTYADILTFYYTDITLEKAG